MADYSTDTNSMSASGKEADSKDARVIKNGSR